MAKERQRSTGLSNLLKNNWVITLTATLIGVFLALYLNELVSSRNRSAQKKIATENIRSEISANKEVLTRSIKTKAQLFETFTFLGTYVDEGENLVAPADSMDRFRKKYPETILIYDSTLLENGNYRYHGEIKMNFSVPHLQLTSVAFETLKSTGMSTTFDFECLMYLEQMDKLTKVVLSNDEKLLEFLNGGKEPGENNQNLLRHLKALASFENSLLESYESSESGLKKCD